MNIAHQEYPVIIALCFLLLVSAQPAGATPTPVIIYGPVVGLNATAHTVTIEADCEQYSCRYNLTGRFEGRVPNEAVYSGIQEGAVVEAVFKEWVWKITTNLSGEYAAPPGEAKDIRQWYSIQRLAYGDDGTTLVGTEIFGDPGYVETPLDAGYEIGYELSGPNPGIYDYKSFPGDTVANTSVKKKSGFNASRIFTTGETYLFSDPSDNTTLSMQFVGGYNGGLAPPKACPCADFHIRVISDKKKAGIAMPGYPEPGAQPGTPASPLPVIIALAAPGIIGFIKRRG